VSVKVVALTWVTYTVAVKATVAVVAPLAVAALIVAKLLAVALVATAVAVLAAVMLALVVITMVMASGIWVVSLVAGIKAAWLRSLLVSVKVKSNSYKFRTTIRLPSNNAGPNIRRYTCRM
jgi:hypothetical protein